MKSYNKYCKKFAKQLAKEFPKEQQISIYAWLLTQHIERLYTQWKYGGEEPDTKPYIKIVAGRMRLTTDRLEAMLAGENKEGNCVLCGISSETIRCKTCAELHRKHPVRKLYELYNSEVKNSKGGKHPAPTYTKETLVDKYLYDSEFIKLYKGWSNNSFSKWHAPSIDRIDFKKPYTMSNIQLMTWKENNDKGAEERSVPVDQYTLDGEFIKTFSSVAEAVNTLDNGYSSGIYHVLNGDTHTYKGYRWTKHGEKLVMREKNTNWSKYDQYTMDGKFIQTFNTASEAMNAVNGGLPGLSLVITGKIRYYKGYRWARHGEPLRPLKEKKLTVKAVKRYTKDGKYLDTWKSINEAGRVLNISVGHIPTVCRGKRPTAHGFIWKYAK